jgi:hypothetical protein
MNGQWYTENVRHMGRSFSGHDTEDGCSCVNKAACGLIVTPGENPDCDQHGQRFTKTMRQMHAGNICPAKPVAANGRAPWPMPSVFIPRQRARAILDALMEVSSNNFVELERSQVRHMRDMAERLGFDPDLYVPQNNRYQFPHKWVDCKNDSLCGWCARPFNVGKHQDN